MLIKVNGKEVFVNDGTTVQGLISLGGMDPTRIVVELNLQILEQERWAATELQNNDVVEVVSFVGGG